MLINSSSQVFWWRLKRKVLSWWICSWYMYLIQEQIEKELREKGRGYLKVFDLFYSLTREIRFTQKFFRSDRKTDCLLMNFFVLRKNFSDNWFFWLIKKDGVISELVLIAIFGNVGEKKKQVEEIIFTVINRHNNWAIFWFQIMGQMS